MNEPTEDLLKELFDYIEDNLYWKVDKGSAKMGDLAGTIDAYGYRVITINNKPYKAHRLIFIYHHGDVPEFLDHIDGNPSNNDISNLREATTKQNGMNRKKNKSYGGKLVSSRFKGVSQISNVKWLSRIAINEERKHLGYFTSEIDAAKAYDKAAIEAFGKFAKLNFDKPKGL